MNRTLRTAVATLVAASAVAVVAAPVGAAAAVTPPAGVVDVMATGPGPSAAKPKPQGGGKQNNKRVCAALSFIFCANVEAASDELEQGNTQAANEAMDVAERARADAKEWGCAWAA